MQKTLIAISAALTLTACQTTGPQPTPQEIAARACPPLEATLLVLSVSPAIPLKAQEEIALIMPTVRALCAADGAASATNLKDLATTSLPIIAQAVADSPMHDKDKQNVLLAIALAQVAISAAR